MELNRFHLRQIVCALLGCLGLAANALSQGGPPLITDDPGTPGPGNWEINVAYTVQKTREEWLFGAPLLDLNYGIGNRVQVQYDLPWVWLKPEGEGARGGLGNSLAGVKWRFLDQDKAGFAMSVFPQVTFNHASDSVRRALAAGGTSVYLPTEIQRRFGPILASLEIGYLWHADAEDQWSYGLALGHGFSKRFELAGEIRDNADVRLARHRPFANVGVRWHFSRHVGLLASVGRSLHDNPSEPALLSYLGLQFLF